MNLTKLNKLTSDFNIPEDDISFHGEHDVVYIILTKEYLPDATDWSDEQKDAFYDKYGIFYEKYDEYWCFYT